MRNLLIMQWNIRNIIMHKRYFTGVDYELESYLLCH